MIKMHACQRNKQFMKDLEHNNFPVRKKKEKKSPKELGKFKLLKNQKIARGFLHELGWKIGKEREYLHYGNVSIFIKFAKV